MENLIELVREHKKMRPLMEIQDVYKLIYQSTLGLGHLLKNHETAKDYLIDEIENIQKVIVKEVLIEDISINNSIVRVNLRPFNEKKMSPEKLFDAMLLTEKKNTSTINDFIKTWELFIKLAEQGKLDFNVGEIYDFNRRTINRKYPIMHHSEMYRKNYKPAYRVIDKEVFNKVFVI